jgi:Ca2+/H+ antiporter, TMEM165/GDT1 family
MVRASEGTGETFGIGPLYAGRARVTVPGLARVRPRCPVVEPFLVSTLVVGLAEIGDKTQILSLILTTRFQRPIPIIFGILFATIANHAAAGLAGTVFGGLFGGVSMRWILAISFLGVAVWALFPDKYEGRAVAVSRLGAFAATLVAFFLAEIGDKTQIATIGLAARFEQFYPVVIGTTLGMMLANIPVVLIGSRIADRLPIFATLGLLTAAGIGE